MSSPDDIEKHARLMNLSGFANPSTKKASSDSTPEPKKVLVKPETVTRAKLHMGIQDITPDTVINDALQTIAIEITRFRGKVGLGKALDPSESRILNGYIKAMCELSKERREQERADQLDKLSTEELAILAKKVLETGSSVIETKSEQADNEEDEE
jgi:hypothetical protein